jgi:hypothetical protein
MKRLKRILWCATVCTAACGTTAPPTVQAAPEDSVEEAGVGRIRRATVAFHSLATAVAAGYAASVPNCIAHSSHGAMGFHHTNRTLLDETLDVDRPEILLYERMPDGAYVLNGVEYIVPYSSRPREAEPPTILGQTLKRADTMELWYLHVWVWNENANGMFADWHPHVECRS